MAPGHKPLPLPILHNSGTVTSPSVPILKAAMYGIDDSLPVSAPSYRVVARPDPDGSAVAGVIVITNT